MKKVLKRVFTRKRIETILFASALVLVATAAFASSDSMPWDNRLTTIEKSISGPTARAIGIILIIATAFGMSYSEGGEGFKKLMKVACCLSIAFSATTLVTGFLGFSGGCGF